MIDGINNFQVTFAIMQKTLLLDFDGVILRHDRATKYIVSRSEKFANKFLKMMTQSDLQRVNREIYRVSGHTSLGLQKLGYENTISDFNDHVYSNIDYESLFQDPSLQLSNRRDIDTLIDLKNSCFHNDVDIRLFSNAPHVWCQEILRRMSPLLSMSSFDEDLTSDLVKPDPRVYAGIEERYPGSRLYFVDDKLENLIPVCDNPRWVKILLDDQHMHKCKSFKNLIVITDICQIKEIL